MARGGGREIERRGEREGLGMEIGKGGDGEGL